MIDRESMERITNPVVTRYWGAPPKLEYALLSRFPHGAKAGAYVHVNDLIRSLEHASQVEGTERIDAPIALRAYAETLRREAVENYGLSAEVE